MYDLSIVYATAHTMALLLNTVGVLWDYVYTNAAVCTKQQSTWLMMILLLFFPGMVLFLTQSEPDSLA